MKETLIGPHKETLKVLLVEDDPTVAELVKGTLEDLGHDVTWCSSAEAALETLVNTEQEFELLYLDIQLPKIDGIELCRRCRETPHPRNPSKSLAENSWIVAMTSLTETQDILSMLSSGANDYITKPVTPKIIQVKTTVCRYATSRSRALRLRIHNLEKQLSLKEAEKK